MLLYISLVFSIWSAVVYFVDFIRAVYAAGAEPRPAAGRRPAISPVVIGE